MSEVDSTLLAEFAAAVEAVPGVERALPVVRHEVRRAPRPTPKKSTVDVKRPEPVAGPPAEVSGGELPLGADDPSTLQEALAAAARLAPDKGIVYIAADGSEDFQSYPQLLADAQRALTGLRRTGIRPGEAVLFQCADKRNFYTAFWACVLGGYVPSPVATPLGYDRENAVTRKLRSSWELLDRPLIVTDERLASAVRGLSVLWDVEDLRVQPLEALASGAESTDWHPAQPDDPAVHVLTSGSTGIPKCVRHAHRSMLARTKGAALLNGFTSDDVSLSWMPSDHVGGVIAYNVGNVVLRHQHVNAEIEAFLADPPVWMDWVHRHRVTNTWAPNFAFSLVAERAAEVSGRDWDLSCLRHICSGGEAVVSRTVHRFLELLTPFGLPATAVQPSFGMSEVSAGVTYSALSAADDTVGTLCVDKATLSGGLRFARPGDPDTITFTDLGPPLPGVRLRIVDDSSAVLPEDHIGRLQISGATVMTGYHRNPEANAASFTADGWFTTGDLGFLHDGRLTLTGRENDLIIIQGANYLSYDIESIVEQVEGTEVTFAAACAYSEPGSQTDKLLVFFVPTSEWIEDQRGTVERIRAKLAREIGLQPDHVIPVDRAHFPKTTSGKIQRTPLLADFRNGRFDDVLRELEDGEEPDGALPDWFFVRTWLPEPVEPVSEAPTGTWLLTADSAGFADELRALLPDLVVGRSADGPVAGVIHVAEGSSARDVVFPVLETLQGQPAPVVLVLTENGVWAQAGDRVDVAKAALPGLVRTAVAERTVPLLRMVDAAREHWASAVAAELRAPAGADLVAYRDGRRLAPKLRPVRPGPELPSALVAGGAYLITGGLGGLGHEVSQYLLAAYQVRLLLIGRSPAGEKLADLRELGDVEYRQVDVSDVDALRAAVTEAELRWGRRLDGVLHLAGSDMTAHGSRLEQHTVARESTAAFDEVYRPKVDGTLALADLLADRPDTLLVLFSSVNGDFGGSSFGAYSSANSFLNGFADHWGHERGRPVRSLVWSMWTDVGMNQGAMAAAARSRGFLGIDASTGLESLLAALPLGHPHLLIGLDGRNDNVIRELAPGQLRGAEVVVAYTADPTITPERLRAELATAAGTLPLPVRFLAMSAIPDDPAEVLAAALAEKSRRGRPFAAPATDLERRLAAVWTEVLGRAEIGRDDLFFDLGGSSLRATQLIARINSALDGQLFVHQLYENPTVGQLAEVLAKQERTATP